MNHRDNGDIIFGSHTLCLYISPSKQFRYVARNVVPVFNGGDLRDFLAVLSRTVRSHAVHSITSLL